MKIDDFVAGTGSDNMLYTAVAVAAAADEHMSLDWERKTPTIPMIDVYYKTKLVNSVLNGNSCKTAFAKRNSYGNCGLVHAGSCSCSSEAIISLLERFPCNDTPSLANNIAGMTSCESMAESFSRRSVEVRCACSQRMFAEALRLSMEGYTRAT